MLINSPVYTSLIAFSSVVISLCPLAPEVVVVEINVHGDLADLAHIRTDNTSCLVVKTCAL